MDKVSLDVGLKDWEAVCRALASGRQTLLLRKGGIHETAGVFELEQSRFILFPTWLHQNIEWIKPDDRADAQTFASEPDTVTLSTWAQVAEIVRVRSRAAIDALADEHIYLPPLIDMRFNYRPDKPLYVLIIRAYQLATPITIQNMPAYSGCRSWVPLENPIDLQNSSPALSDAEFALHRERVKALIG